MWRTVLELFAALGRPPRLQEIASETGRAVEDLRVLVSKLQAHDLLGLDKAAGVIAYAYPFTEQETEHRYGSADGSFAPSAPSMLLASPPCFEQMS